MPATATSSDPLSQTQRRLQGLLLSSLTHLLTQQSWARERLRQHAGSTVRVAIGARDGFRAQVGTDGLPVPADSHATADASLQIEASMQPLLAIIQDGTVGLQRHLRIEGDVALAATLGELARSLRWDAEEDLSRLIGDIAAHRLARLGSALFEGARSLRDRADSAATQFAASGVALPARQQWQALIESLEDLRPILEPLDARVRALESRAGNLADSRSRRP